MKKLYDTLLYVFSHLGVQFVIAFFITFALTHLGICQGSEGKITVIISTSILSGIITLALFMGLKWCNIGVEFLKKKPWSTLSLTALLSLMLITPVGFLTELLPEEMSENVMAEEFDALIGSFWGYIVIALVAPFIEELVFRGAILRRLLERNEGETHMTTKESWKAIIVSALIFSITHMNPAQIPYAFLIGILLGWLYWRTQSIIPGVIYHWVNNSFPFVITALFPDDVTSETTVMELFQDQYITLSAVLIVTSTISFFLIKRINTEIQKSV